MSPLGQAALAMAVVFLVAGCTPQWAREASATGAVEAGARSCSTCKLETKPTGQTKMEWAQRYHLYRCAAGHQEWILADPGRRVDQVVVSDPCPSCGRQLRWTGQVNGFGEHATRVFACEAGHSVVRRR
jgi:hypothetical protein